jgi:hypothetical protein
LVILDNTGILYRWADFTKPYLMVIGNMIGSYRHTVAAGLVSISSVAMATIACITMALLSSVLVRHQQRLLAKILTIEMVK